SNIVDGDRLHADRSGPADGQVVPVCAEIIPAVAGDGKTCRHGCQLVEQERPPVLNPGLQGRVGRSQENAVRGQRVVFRVEQRVDVGGQEGAIDGVRQGSPEGALIRWMAEQGPHHRVVYRHGERIDVGRGAVAAGTEDEVDIPREQGPFATQRLVSVHVFAATVAVAVPV